MKHEHSFTEWPFDTPVYTVSFTTRFVIDGSKPILDVYHDHDGYWQFLCGTTTDAADLMLVCMGCMLDRDPALFSLARLPAGWRAVRRSENEGWLQEAYEDLDDSAGD